MTTRPFIPLALLVTMACVQEATIPKIGEQVIELTIAVSHGELAPGQVDTITVSATNHLEQNVRLVFPTTCQILVYIRNRTSRLVVPEGGSYDCIPVPSQIVFPAMGTVNRQFIWQGGSDFVPPGTAARLPAGDYFVTATMNAQGYSTSAFAVRITLLQ